MLPSTFLRVPPIVFHAGPGEESKWSALDTCGYSGTWPIDSAATFAEEWVAFLFFESLANAGAAANTTMARALTILWRICCFAVCIRKPPSSERGQFQPRTIEQGVCLRTAQN